MQLPQHTPSVSASSTGVRVNAADVLGSAGGARPGARSLYIHTPFCVHKCHYCDFYSFVDSRDQQEAFVDRLIEELEALSPHAVAGDGGLRTIFVGGGTPSLLRVELWERVLRTLDRVFDLAAIRGGERDEWGAAEFTVECNPESATPELMSVLKAGGVNRVSIGAQSFHDKHLKTLERWHNPENVARAVEAARRAGIERQSVDLIFAIPGQTLEEWDADLKRALGLGTTHLSCYNLTYEPNTAMTKRLALGQFTPCPEELEEEMFLHTVATLCSAGLERYEVSNFARPGDESRHNIAYWLQEQWLAAGPSASGHAWAGSSMRAGSARWKNVPRLGDYLSSSGFAPVMDVEAPDPARLVRERIMMGLRLARGLEYGPLVADAEAAAPGSEERLLRMAGRMAEKGYLEVRGGWWVTTDAGFLMCDWMAGEMMGAM